MPHDADMPNPPQIALSVRAHDRVGHRRTDDAWLAETWADPSTRVLLLARGHFPVDGSGTAVAWLSPGEAPEGQRVFLGETGGVAHFGVLLDEAPDDWANLRIVGPQLSPADASLLVHALALAEWHRAHRFCARCGSSLNVAAAGHVLTCTGCGRQHFPRTDPAVIMLVTDDQDRALLGRQVHWPEGRFSTLAGFVEPGESIEHAVVREVHEESGVAVGEVEYVASQPWPFPSSLMLGFMAQATSPHIEVDGDEIQEARWFSRDELGAAIESGEVLPLAGISIAARLVELWYGKPLPRPAR